MFSPGICFFYRFGAVRALLSFPTRRSSDLHFTAGDLVTNAYTRFSARLTGHYVASVGIPKDYRSFGFDDPRHLATLDPALSFVEEQTRATAPERKLLSRSEERRVGPEGLLLT